MDNWTKGWTMFTTSKEEIAEMAVDLGTVVIEPDNISIINYPFKPSIAFRQTRFQPSDITNIDVSAGPPNFRVGSEVIFISATEKDRLLLFGYANQIPIIERKDLWSWILEPFLDTEYTEEMHHRLNALLSDFGLTENDIDSIRNEVGVQMYKYNFDTMLWEWVHLDALDVLRAMRPKYNTAQFEDFYNRVMKIVLLSEQ